MTLERPSQRLPPMHSWNSQTADFWATDPRQSAISPTFTTLGLTQFLALVLLVSVYRLICLAWPGLELFPDEAQYYLWSLEPAFGYFSKPPIVAWLIALSTHALGDSEFAIRLPSLVCYAATAVVVFLLVRRLYDDTTAFVAGTLFLTLPTVAFFSRFITTDAPLMLFWALALSGFIRALEQDRARDYALAGLWLGLGLQSKYSMIVFLGSALLFMLSDKSLARRLLSARVHLGWASALVVFAPNLLWNLDNAFISFEHTAEISQLDRQLFHPDHLIEFGAMQLLVFGPLLFPALWWSLGFVVKHWRDRRVRLFAAFCFPFLGLILVQSLLSRAFYNWAAPAYVSGTVLLTVFFLTRRAYRALIAALLLNILIGAIAYHYVETWQLLAGPVERKNDLYARLRGWDDAGSQLEDKLSAAAASEAPQFVVFDDRKAMAELMYYAPSTAPSGRIWNHNQRLSDHYRLTRDAAKESSASLLLVLEDLPREYVEQRCERVRSLEPIRVKTHPDSELYFELYRASTCRF